VIASYFLIIVVLSGSQGAAVTSVPMQNLQLCETAAEKVVKMDGIWATAKATCVKGES